MQNVNRGIEMLVKAAEQYAPRDLGEGVAHLESLGIFAELREAQAMDAGFMAMFVGEITASLKQGGPGIHITCVGMESSMDGAVASAVAQWAMGVLPVLVKWRGQHDCLTDVEELQTRGGSYDVMIGPTLLRAAPEGAASGEGVDHFMHLLGPELSGLRLKPRVQWLEMFASKSDDGAVQATCRWNNRDWFTGQQVLAKTAATWPPPEQPMRSCRQFALLLPKDRKTEDLVLPTIWERLRGRA
jgi:hypothetical protein